MDFIEKFTLVMDRPGMYTGCTWDMEKLEIFITGWQMGFTSEDSRIFGDFYNWSIMKLMGRKSYVSVRWSDLYSKTLKSKKYRNPVNCMSMLWHEFLKECGHKYRKESKSDRTRTIYDEFEPTIRQEKKVRKKS